MVLEAWPAMHLADNSCILKNNKMSPCYFIFYFFHYFNLQTSGVDSTMKPLMTVGDAEKESMYGYIHTVSGPGKLIR